MVSLCPFGEEVDRGPTGECGHLSVDEDGLAICSCEEALETYVGSGCIFQCSDMQDIYLFHLNEYNVEERRIALQEEVPHYTHKS
jgi:hypothetical protein